jgi:hypothetical protein
MPADVFVAPKIAGKSWGCGQIGGIACAARRHALAAKQEVEH